MSTVFIKNPRFLETLMMTRRHEITLLSFFSKKSHSLYLFYFPSRLQIQMATFVVFIETPTWEFHHDPEHGSYHFEGSCTVRVFMFPGRPFAHHVDSYMFSPTHPYGDDGLVFERARTRDERILRTYTAGSGAVPQYVPRTQGSEEDPAEDPPTHMYGEDSAPTPPRMPVGSEDTVSQPMRVRMAERRPRRGGSAGTSRVPTPEAIRPWIGYVPPYQRYQP